ncbi:A-kinase anchor protein 14 [Leptinotarsa decemlineata]|uniref:A-kinase anchor protein 14 n=1 Tax=Leptinotarsa decemlineata TaxID=7539 RepID=UPI003D3096A4
MSEIRESIRTITNIITIRGLDTISISPSSLTKLKCEGSDIFGAQQSSDSENEEGSFESDNYPNLYSPSFHDNRMVMYTRVRPKEKCLYFMDYEEFTHIFVDEILDAAVKAIRKTYNALEIVKLRHPSFRTIPSWPTIEEFDEKLGTSKLKEYIDCTSEVTEDWLYSVELIAKQSNNHSDFYTYEAKFGIPTKCYPVPQATASVFFKYEVSRIKPRFCPVDVTFQFEASNSVLMPGTNYITEKLLFRIIDAKIAYYKTVRF